MAAPASIDAKAAHKPETKVAKVTRTSSLHLAGTGPPSGSCCLWYTSRVERLVWIVLMFLVFITVVMWGISEPDLFKTQSDLNLDICTFVASDESNRTVAWAAVSGSVLLVSFSLLIESQLSDIAFHDNDPRKQATKTLKRVTIREFFIAGSVAIIVWVSEVIYDALSGSEKRGGHSTVDVFLHTLEFLDKTMLLLMLVYLALVLCGLSLLKYISSKAKMDAARLSLVAVHFFLNFPYYVKTASFVLSLLLLDDIFWPGSDGYYTFTTLLLASVCIVLIWLRVAAGPAIFRFPLPGLLSLTVRKGPLLSANANRAEMPTQNIIPEESKRRDSQNSVDGSNKSVSLEKESLAVQMQWARHTKLLKQFVGLIGCMISSLFLIWTLRMMCVKSFDMPWLLPLLLTAATGYVEG